MFYAHFVLAKKGPLARIWLAAHWDKKLTKAHVFETNIEKSVEGILQPKVKMALRTSGHLLLGVVRIYSRKAKYLLADCNEAFVKIKMAFRPGMVDLPEENREAAVNAITLPEVFHDFDTAMPTLEDVDLRIQTQFTMSNTTRAEEITMREDYGNLNLDTGGDDGFGDVPGMDMDGPHSTLRSGSLSKNQLREESLFSDDHTLLKSPGKSLNLDDHLGDDDGFGGTSDLHSGDLFQGGGLFDEPTLGSSTLQPELESSRLKSPGHHGSMSDDDDAMSDRDLGMPSPGGMSSIGGGSRAGSPLGNADDMGDMDSHKERPTRSTRKAPADATSALSAGVSDDDLNGDHARLVTTQEEIFALDPIDTSALRGHNRTKRKRKLVVDEIKAIAGEEMKAQLSDTSDIVATLDLAPPTKRLMQFKETGGVEKLFALPGIPLHSATLSKAYQNLLTIDPSEVEIFGLLGESDKENLVLDHVPGEEFAQPEPKTPGKRGRKRKNITEEPPEWNETVTTPSRRSSRHLTEYNEPVFSPRKENGPTEVDFLSDPRSAAPHENHHFSNMGYDASSESNSMANLGWDGGASMREPLTPGDGMSMGVPSVGPPSMGGQTPYHDDEDEEEDEYDIHHSHHPSTNNQGATHNSSLGELESEEMLEGETIEEFEDRVLNKRAAHLNTILKSKLAVLPELKLSNMTRRNTRKQAAQKFYSLLVLQKALAVNIDQPELNGDINVTKGPRFETAVI